MDVRGGVLMAVKRRVYKRDKRARFAPTGSTRVRRIARKVNHRRPHYVRGSLGKTVRFGRAVPGGEDAGVHVGTKLRTKRRASTTSAFQPAGKSQPPSRRTSAVIFPLSGLRQDDVALAEGFEPYSATWSVCQNRP